MNKESRRTIRATLMVSAAMLIVAPAVAQEAQTAPTPAPVAPPPVVAPAPAPSVAPPVIRRTVVPTPAAATPAEGTPAADGESPTRVNPEAAAQAAAEDAERRVERRATPRGEPRRAAPAQAAAAAPAATAVASQPVTPPVAAPTPQAAPVASAPEAQPETAPADTATTAETKQVTEEPGVPMWPLALIAALIVAAGAFFFMRRRREPEHEEYVEEPVYVEPAPEPVVARAMPASAVAASAAAAGVMVDDGRIERATSREEIVAPSGTVMVEDTTPVAAEAASVEQASGEDVAALTAVDAPADRPWLEFGFRPVRAGANVDEALVEIELTVANAGNLPAEDVRISTFMLPAGDVSEMERLLVEPHDENVTSVTIPAGEGTRIDATLATSRAALVNGAEHAAFQPVIVAHARYRLPDGSEGRTSASFVVGGTLDGGVTLEPLSLDRPVVREDVAAHLYREPKRV